MRLRLHSVNKVREFNGVLNEENGNVISDDIPVAFFSIKLGCKPSDIADSVLHAGRRYFSQLCGTKKKLIRTALPREPCTVLKRINTGVVLEESVRTGANVYFEARSSNTLK